MKSWELFYAPVYYTVGDDKATSWSITAFFLVTQTLIIMNTKRCVVFPQQYLLRQRGTEQRVQLGRLATSNSTHAATMVALCIQLKVLSRQQYSHLRTVLETVQRRCLNLRLFFVVETACRASCPYLNKIVKK